MNPPLTLKFWFYSNLMAYFKFLFLSTRVVGHIYEISFFTLSLSLILVHFFNWKSKLSAQILYLIF